MTDHTNLITPRDWQIQAQAEAAKLVGTDGYTARMAEARRYGAMAVALEAAQSRIEWLERFAALAALDTAHPEPVNAMLVEALERMVESVTGVDQVSAVNEARAALTAAKQAQPEPSDLRGIDACPVAEWVDLVKRGYVSRDECLIAVKDIPLWIAKNSEQAQPERAPLSDAELEQEFCNITGLETGINPAAADTKRALVWFKKGYAHAIKQGGQHEKDQ